MKKYKLSEVAKVEISSVDKKTKENETLVRLCNFTDVYHNWAITMELSDKFMMASANSNEIEKFSIRKGQVAFTKDSETRDDIGIPTYIADDFDNVLLGYHCALITPDKSIVCGKYLNAFMHSTYIQKYFENRASGSGQRYTLSRETIEEMPLLLPSLEKQRIIGDLFSSIDRKIALNRSINQNLEALAKQIYDYWFVQFDFPDENGRPYKSSGGKMVWNEVLKREVPEGWEVKKLGEITAKLDSGKRPAGGIDKNLKTGIPSLGAECIDKLGVFDFSSTPYIPIQYRLKLKNGRIENNDILIYKDGAYVGKTTLFRDNFPFKEAFVNEHVFLIHTKIKKFQEYLFYTLRLPAYFEIMQRNGKKAAQPGLNQDDIKNIMILLPPENIVSLFRDKIDFIHKSIFYNSKNSAILTNLRDELLPLLMNGQVTIE